ncbi:hypothetical protein ACOJCD_003319 [Cronobacter dublinensis]
MKLLSSLLLMIAALLSTGCVEVAHKVDKVLTFRTWENYESDVNYADFNPARHQRVSFSKNMFPVWIADNNSWLKFNINFGSCYAGLNEIKIDDFANDIAPFKAFLAWSGQPFAERESTLSTLNARDDFKNNKYYAINEAVTHEPLFVFSRDVDLFHPERHMALTRKDITHVILMAITVKVEHDQAAKAQK